MSKGYFPPNYDNPIWASLGLTPTQEEMNCKNPVVYARKKYEEHLLKIKMARESPPKRIQKGDLK